MQVHDSLSELVGNTPLVRLRSVTRGIPGANVLAKVEYFNPGGSVKDRIALRMVVAAEGGYRCVFVCPDKVAQDKIAVLRAYGAEVVVCPGTVAPDHPDSYYSVARRLAAETPGGWQPDQYANPENPASGPGGGPADRRIVRAGGGGRAPRGGVGRAGRGDRRAAARRRPRLPVE